MSANLHVLATVAILATSGLLATAPAHADTAQLPETAQANDGGIINASDSPLYRFVEIMDRFPDRVGIICQNAYYLDKTGGHEGAMAFLKECAKRGNAPSMVYLAHLYDQGRSEQRNPEASTYWVKRGADSGYSTAQYHYGMALLNGYGTAPDVRAAKLWLERAAEQGDADATRILAEQPAFHPMAAVAR